MQSILGNIKIDVNEKVYIKNPINTEIGKKILSEGIILISDHGLENFNFKKLAEKISTTESSIYRYFENKHKLLIYYTNVYWGILDHILILKTTNIDDPKIKISKFIETIIESTIYDIKINEINLTKLHYVFINESSKSYLTRLVDEENKNGYFLTYKRFCKRAAQFITEINSNYQFANSIITTIIEGLITQKYFSEHLPSLSSVKGEESKINLQLTNFFESIIIKTIS